MRAILFLGLLGLAMSPLGAPLLAGSHPMEALLVRRFFSALCHQNPARSFVWHGSPVAVCVRCLGIYFGVAAGSLLAVRHVVAVRWLGVALGLNLVDVVAAHGNWPLSRFLLGVLLGLATGALLFTKTSEGGLRFS